MTSTRTPRHVRTFVGGMALTLALELLSALCAWWLRRGPVENPVLDGPAKVVEQVADVAAAPLAVAGVFVAAITVYVAVVQSRTADQEPRT
ncbi:hypothetical protein ACIO3O_40055 [Streptomyces sp. NPDC087440]|uniref:hypothetical protein n=1 Tax=Streptomyces sp. NPDC087440 TaxID=3365790 RepID=UPI00380EB44B